MTGLLRRALGVADPCRIRVAHDGGISSPRMQGLRDGLATLEAVGIVVSAPDTNKAGSGQWTGGGARTVGHIFANGEFFGYAVDGRPADAVRFGLLHLGKDEPFDLVVSGINQGANVGDVSHLSGTVGAAMEAIYQGIPAIAVSQDTANVDTSVTVNLTRQLVAKYQRDGAPEGIVISINVPGGELKGVAVRPMGESYLKFSPYELTRTDGEVSEFEASYVGNRALDSTSDTYAYQNGYATITPLKFDWTAHEMLSEIETWGLAID